MSLNVLNAESGDAFGSLLELAANNDLEGFREYVDREPSSVDEVGLWYGRQKGSNQMVLHHRTPLMVAATYGSIDVLKQIIDSSEVDVNRSCGVDRSTALHCAASGGSINAADIVKLLLAAGADPNLADAGSCRPIDVIVVSPMFQGMKYSLQMMLTADSLSKGEHNLRVLIGSSNTNSQPVSPTPGNGSPCAPSESSPSLCHAKLDDVPVSSAREKKEYPIDFSLPDIKNNIYSTDEFRMFSFKIRPCSRAYSHDWTECPFLHPGENARRRDPRKYHYSCVPCPDSRRGACPRGDMCECAHGVFESWLHPAQYRTRLCKDGTSCNRRVCFFAHTEEELRPLYVSTDSAVPSPRSIISAANAMDFTAVANFLPGSPPTAPVMSPSLYTPPMSPSNNGNMGWSPQQNIPVLHLPGSNLQASRLRSSLNARDFPAEDLSLYADVDLQQQQQLLSALSLLSQRSVSTNLFSRSAHPKALTPSNLEDFFSAESSSPRYSDQAFPSAVFSPKNKSAVYNQFQPQQHSMLSPIKTNLSPRTVDHSLLQAPFELPSPRRMSPRNVEPISPMSARVSMIAEREKQHQQIWSLSSSELQSYAAADVASLDETLSMWETPNGTPEWAITSSFELVNNGEEPDLSWVQSLVKESPQDMKEKSASQSRIVGNAGAGTSSGEGEKFSS